MTRAISVAIVAGLDDAATQLCNRELATDDVLWHAGSEWDPALAECEVIFGNIPVNWVPSLTALRWLQLESIGFENYATVTPELRARSIEVTNLRGLFSQPVAETALAGILALLRGIDQLVAATAEQRWATPEIRPGTELLSGRRVVVLGTGSIGAKLRRLFEAFDCTVVSYARESPTAELHTLAELDAALATASIVASCLPGTQQTVRIFDRERLALLGDRTILVNVGRGSAVDEAALCSSLAKNALGGAVLDVTEQEPLDADSPLWLAPRTILTQHTGGGYRDELRDKARRFLDNLAEWRVGKPLANTVNWEAGY
ncbi:D-2-hydroxyacid dehydrogenase [Rhodoglobus aureus]|uniref:D-2-hydroxyacid dehydrogenase n=1 Tax=Rhodoglobus aureus TaxID=191497 RepID=A0ABN1VLK6_9MICO